VKYHELLLIGAVPEAGEEAARWVEASCDRFGFAGTPVNELALCVVEAVNNSIEHAYGAIPGEVTLTLAADHDSVRVVVSDRGAGPADDAITEPAADAMRGRGRWIMSRWCDSVSYERTRTGFRTVLTKQCATQAA
jgi:anti-sigma regulatory factor (Ser/Thr protein kinase)